MPSCCLWEVSVFVFSIVSFLESLEDRYDRCLQLGWASRSAEMMEARPETKLEKDLGSLVLLLDDSFWFFLGGLRFG